jgi:DNA ligase (NAD+)|tara:strand:- start:1369 stop:1617 length:249 start_codon:yes stop_codon:yes gene_type:complete
MENSIKEKHIVFTGKMQHGDRDEMKAEAKQLGAIIQSEVNSKTDILVYGEDVAHNAKHTKMNKANELGITILDEKSYYSFIK